MLIAENQFLVRAFCPDIAVYKNGQLIMIAAAE